jgi:hypothetical protein
METQTQKTEYFVMGARSAWDTVEIGLYTSYSSALADLPIGSSPNIIRIATDKEIETFLNNKKS